MIFPMWFEHPDNGLGKESISPTPAHSVQKVGCCPFRLLNLHRQKIAPTLNRLLLRNPFDSRMLPVAQ